MVITPPAGSQVTVAAPVTTSSVNVRVSFDTIANTMTVYYGINPVQGEKSVTLPTPVSLQTALQTALQSAIETNEGWPPGSSTIQAANKISVIKAVP